MKKKTYPTGPRAFPNFQNKIWIKSLYRYKHIVNNFEKLKTIFKENLNWSSFVILNTKGQLGSAMLNKINEKKKIEIEIETANFNYSIKIKINYSMILFDNY